MIVTKTKEDYKKLLERKLERLAVEVEDIANAHFGATEMLKDGIYEGNEEKQAYYTKMSDELHSRLERKGKQVEKVAYVYRSMFGLFAGL